ncbi:MAG: hypothetical protein Q8P57_00280 [Candidatus Pacearchaeota archaeon]|nr:hypothetical protein [Candidatus Pacearchaeota archaeon]
MAEDSRYTIEGIPVIRDKFSEEFPWESADPNTASMGEENPVILKFLERNFLKRNRDLVRSPHFGMLRERIGTEIIYPLYASSAMYTLLEFAGASMKDGKTPEGYTPEGIPIFTRALGNQKEGILLGRNLRGLDTYSEDGERTKGFFKGFWTLFRISQENSNLRGMLFEMAENSIEVGRKWKREYPGEFPSGFWDLAVARVSYEVLKKQGDVYRLEDLMNLSE